jgi:hypothetical protein
MRTTATIAGREVPIQDGEPITISSSGGRMGPSEAGVWEFWTVFNGEFNVTARCLQGSDPGERFRIVEGERGYEKAWEVASTAKGLRPATEAEVLKWLNDKSHKDDAPHAQECHIGDGRLAVVKTADGSEAGTIPVLGSGVRKSLKCTDPGALFEDWKSLR